MVETKIIEAYFKNGYSLIPLKNNTKLPAIRWKRYQYRQASKEEILSWSSKFPGHNWGIATGLKLVAVDVDDPTLLPELLKLLPGLWETTRVKSLHKGRYHFYFSNNEHKIRSTKNLFGLGIELRAKGNQVVVPPSKIGNFIYHFEIPLSEIQPLPEQIIKEYQIIEEGITLPGRGIKEGKQAPGVEYKKRRVLPLPRYAGKNVSCIEQILSRELREGERDNSLFILYNLLLQNRNKKEYSKKLVIDKNNLLAKPITDQDMEKVFKKAYGLNGLKCSKVREFLPFIECSKCRFKFKGGVLGMGNILVKNIRKLPELTNTERGIICLLGTVFDGEKPSISKIALKARMNYQTVQKVIDSLKEKGIIK